MYQVRNVGGHVYIYMCVCVLQLSYMYQVRNVGGHVYIYICVCVLQLSYMYQVRKVGVMYIYIYIYMCVTGIDFASVSVIFYYILELFRQYRGVSFFHFIFLFNV